MCVGRQNVAVCLVMLVCEIMQTYFSVYSQNLEPSKKSTLYTYVLVDLHYYTDFIYSHNYDDLGDVKYFPMLGSQNNVQKSQSPPSDAQNQEPHIKRNTEYDFPAFTTFEQQPQVTDSFNLLTANGTTHDAPSSNPQSSDPPADPLYDPVTLEPAAQLDRGSKSPVVEYDKLVHSPTPQGIHINCKYYLLYLISLYIFTF